MVLAAGVGGAVVSRGSAPRWHLPTPGGSHPQLVEVQRSRLLSAAIRAVDELGYQGTSVTDITSRARVSRRTFYELFCDREACLAAALIDLIGSIEAEVVDAVSSTGADGIVWRERVRTGLWAILCFFDREPALARVCIVQSLRGGPAVLGAREEALARLVTIVDEGRGKSKQASECSALIAEGLVGAAVAIIHTRLLRDEEKPLRDLFGELVAMIFSPYLGPAAARREQKRPIPTTPPASVNETAATDRLSGHPLEGIPIRLTYRTMRVIEGVAARPGSSNRQVASDAGITDQGQISKLLARLERKGLLANEGKGRNQEGEPNAWKLTPTGERIAQSIDPHPHGHEQAPV